MFNILLEWFVWHYKEMPKEIFRAWKNFFKFNLEYFSILLLLKTFFSPWRKYEILYGRGFNIGKYLEAFFSNIIFRILGAVIRSILIIIGLLVQIFIIFFGMIIFISWLLLPVFLILGFYYGFKILY
jgi:hypothetical protein